MGCAQSRPVPPEDQLAPRVSTAASNSPAHNPKVVVIGESEHIYKGVGKSCLLVRYTTQRFNDASTTTIGSAFKRTSVQLLDGNTLGIDIWDTAGQERYRALAPMYLRDAAGALLVYDITSADSFQACQGWLEQLQKLNERRPCTAICLAGNKSDLVVASGQRQVAKQQAQQFAEQHGLGFEEVSALTGDGVDAAFLHIGQRLQQQLLLQLPEPRQA